MLRKLIYPFLVCLYLFPGPCQGEATSRALKEQYLQAIFSDLAISSSGVCQFSRDYHYRNGRLAIDCDRLFLKTLNWDEALLGQKPKVSKSIDRLLPAILESELKNLNTQNAQDEKINSQKNISFIINALLQTQEGADRIHALMQAEASLWIPYLLSLDNSERTKLTSKIDLPYSLTIASQLFALDPQDRLPYLSEEFVHNESALYQYFSESQKSKFLPDDMRRLNRHAVAAFTRCSVSKEYLSSGLSAFCRRIFHVLSPKAKNKIKDRFFQSITEKIDSSIPGRLPQELSQDPRSAAFVFTEVKEKSAENQNIDVFDKALFLSLFFIAFGLIVFSFVRRAIGKKTEKTKVKEPSILSASERQVLRELRQEFGLSPYGTLEDLHKSYRRQVIGVHPDKISDGGVEFVRLQSKYLKAKDLIERLNKERTKMAS